VNKPTGRTSTTDYLVLLALLDRARKGANEHGLLRASERELAEKAHCTPKTVRKALKRLMDNLWIFRGKQDETSTAYLWRFSDKVINRGRYLYKSTPLPLNHYGGGPQWVTFVQ
jgi:DNA-binding FadR family transcriptional regulator